MGKNKRAMSKTQSNRPNAFDVVKSFEEGMRKYTGAGYACAVDSCSMALFLCFSYLKELVRLECEEYESSLSPEDIEKHILTMPSETFISVPMMAIHAGWRIRWRRQTDWQLLSGKYRIPVSLKEPFGECEPAFPVVIDSALHLERNMYRDIELAEQGRLKCGPPGPLMPGPPLVCLSFQYRKTLQIGRGGMILSDSRMADAWFRRARFFGRHEVPAEEEPGPTMIGWHGYMEPARAAAGLSLLMHLPDKNKPVYVEYPDLSEYRVFKPYVD